MPASGLKYSNYYGTTSVLWDESVVLPSNFHAFYEHNIKNDEDFVAKMGKSF